MLTVAQTRFPRLNVPELLAEVYVGVHYEDVIQVTTGRRPPPDRLNAFWRDRDGTSLPTTVLRRIPMASTRLSSAQSTPQLPAQQFSVPDELFVYTKRLTITHRPVQSLI